MKHANRLQFIEPFHAMVLLARARELEAEGRSIIHMEVGEPDFTTPDPILIAGKKVLDQGKIQYTPAKGIVELRQKIADFYVSRFDVSINIENIVVTPGASGALLLTLGAILNPNDEVLMTDPGYPCNRHFVRLFDAVPITIPVSEQTNFQLSPELVKQNWLTNTVAVMIASPSNPCGTTVSLKAMQQIYEIVNSKNGVLIVDEIYQNLNYANKPFSALAVSNTVFVINSFSKYFCMTGWRLGWLVVPDDYVEAVDKIAQNIFLSAPAPAQYAALEAFNPQTLEILEDRRRNYMRRRDLLLSELPKLGFNIPVIPEGAFYIYADCSRLTDNSFDFCVDLLERQGVAMTPGMDFGHYNADRYVRISYTTSLDNLREGLRRLQQYISN